MKILGVFNPISGGINKDKFLDYFKITSKNFGIQTEVLETTGNDDVLKIKQALDSFIPDLVIAIGGDGTFAITALAAAGTNTNVGIIPFGSSNGMAKELGVNLSPEIAFDDLLKSRLVRQLDLININESTRCIHLADVGFNARVVKGFESDINRGMLTYGKYLAKELQTTTPIKYTVNVNDETISGECVMIIIANGRKYGTGVSITESGNPFDGVFELVIIEEINFGTILKAGFAIIDQLYSLGHNNGRVISTSSAKIQFEQPELLQVDGEVIGEFGELNISIMPKQVNLLTTGSNLYISTATENSETVLN